MQLATFSAVACLAAAPRAAVPILKAGLLFYALGVGSPI